MRSKVHVCVEMQSHENVQDPWPDPADGCSWGIEDTILLAGRLGSPMTDPHKSFDLLVRSIVLSSKAVLIRFKGCQTIFPRCTVVFYHVIRPNKYINYLVGVPEYRWGFRRG